MTIHAHDLPAHIRRTLPKPAPRRARVTTLVPVARTGALWWVCHHCGAEWANWGGVNGAEAHSREQRHPRVEMVWASDGEATG